MQPHPNMKSLDASNRPTSGPPTSGPIVAGIVGLIVILSGCSRNEQDPAASTSIASASTPVSGPVAATTVAVVPTTVPPVAPAPVSTLPVAPPTAAVVDGTGTSTPTGSSVPADGKVVYNLVVGDRVLEVQESPEQTTFVVSDESENVIFFEIFDNADPAFNDLFETPAGGGAADTELVLRDDAGVEVVRVRLADVVAARENLGQTPATTTG